MPYFSPTMRRQSAPGTFTMSPLRWTAELVRRHETRHQAAVSSLVEQALSADEIDRPTIAKLASRECFAAATSRLLSLCIHRTAADELLPVLLDPHNGRFRLFRLAVLFGAESPTLATTRPLLTDEELRARATKGDERAAMTLACYGRPVAAFGSLTRQERAAYLLHTLTDARRLT